MDEAELERQLWLEALGRCRPTHPAGVFWDRVWAEKARREASERQALEALRKQWSDAADR